MMRRRDFLGAGGLLLGSALLSACGTAKGAVLRDGRLAMAVVATYGTGTATYADVAAVANAMTNAKDVNIRIVTSDTAIGRMTPLRSGQATFARTGDEYIFAFEAEHEFATREWGPQPTRVVWGPVAPHSLLTTSRTGIVDLADLRGKKIPLITANPSVNGKITSFLAAGGLTREDVELVPISYGEQADALKSGKLDILFQQVYGSSLFELESAATVRWVELDEKDEATIRETSPSVRLGSFTGAPGQKGSGSDIGMIYSVPLITYAESDDDLVYAFARDIVDTYPAYEKATATTPDWGIDEAMTAPVQVPFHPGLIRLLEERDMWPESSQRRQDELLEREEQLARGWQAMADVSDDELAAAWATWKKENLDD
ncbi:TAXI family TRAP transporter solute-binding subunit [Janibacter melonis]|uniref:TAXI family TRAP transporter solute-binding subunit n=2 Tax=Janibacter melonis TaxID=262209 RepID=UPI001918143A|nr:TAXI family TRAP transporter solute-binding subunit [Janibacter melonis]MCB5992202.1 TAXI family TRAP transporter solute-binding subunit [Janibacter melonis]